MKFGWEIDHFNVNDAVAYVDAVPKEQVDALVGEYYGRYKILLEGRDPEEFRQHVAVQAQIEIGLEKFLEDGDYHAIVTHFGMPGGLKQLPGLAIQRMMEKGYGFGAEGDWKTAAMVRLMKIMTAGMKDAKGTSFRQMQWASRASSSTRTPRSPRSKMSSDGTHAAINKKLSRRDGRRRENMSETGKKAIQDGRAVLGIEFGSTRIKAVLTDETHQPIAMGTWDWENRLENNIWTYSLEDIWKGLQGCYKSLADDVQEKYGVALTKLAALGFSGMMHGYMPFDAKGELLVPFRTWRNTMTGEACKKLVSVFDFNIPQRWSIAHLYQAILSKEEHVKDIAFLTTLAGYVHWKLSGEKVLGIGEASGMFPIDSGSRDYDAGMIGQFDELVAGEGLGWKLRDILPGVLCAGEKAGVLTEEGAKLLDVSGRLQAGVPMCPPEGDAGTGMTATNSVRVRTGNISAGTSIFSMVVTEKALSKVHEEIDMVTTPDGSPVAMVHCNNCTSDLNAWVNLFGEFAGKLGVKADKNELYGALYREALDADTDCGGLVAYNYFSGEPVTGLNEGRPLFVRTPDAKFSLANFMRSHLYSAMAALKIGNDILLKEENVKVDSLTGHGGLFKTPVVGQQLMAAAFDSPVTVMDTASEGGAWGMAVLAAYMVEKSEGETLPDYLNDKIFAGQTGTTIAPKAEDVAGFDAFIRKYKSTLPAEKAAVEGLR